MFILVKLELEHCAWFVSTIFECTPVGHKICNFLIFCSYCAIEKILKLQEGCTCKDTEFGCCPDRKTPAEGVNGKGCGCAASRFGCCPDGEIGN